MTQSTVAPAGTIVTVGVDTHSDIHVAVALDRLGRRLGTTTVPTTPEGYQQLECWARQLGEVDAFGIEGTGSWGAGLVRLLRERGYHLVEVNRPTEAPATGRARTIRWMRRRPPAPSSPAPRPLDQRPARAPWR